LAALTFFFLRFDFFFMGAAGAADSTSAVVRCQIYGFQPGGLDGSPRSPSFFSSFFSLLRGFLFPQRTRRIASATATASLTAAT
jgi:hypothetical protein